MGIRYDAEQIDLAPYYRDVGKYTPLPSEEEAYLARRVRAGDTEARNKLVNHNLRFVISVANHYRNRGVPLGDLIGAGNIGLITAAEKFDGTKGFKFISYAVWWIRQAVLQHIGDHSRIVRLPLNRVDLLAKISKVQSRGDADTLLPKDLEQIADELGLSQDIISETLRYARTAISLDEAYGEGDESNLYGSTPDDSIENPEQEHLRNGLKREVLVAIEALTPREAEVLKLYFGLDGEDEMTLEQIGGRFNLTRERVRQIKERALERLRHAKRSKPLRETEKAYVQSLVPKN